MEIRRYGIWVVRWAVLPNETIDLKLTLEICICARATERTIVATDCNCFCTFELVPNIAGMVLDRLCLWFFVVIFCACMVGIMIAEMKR